MKRTLVKIFFDHRQQSKTYKWKKESNLQKLIFLNFKNIEKFTPNLRTKILINIMLKNTTLKKIFFQQSDAILVDKSYKL